MIWLDTWVASFPNLSGVSAPLVATVVLIATYLFIIIPSAAIVSYLDRKLTADFQARVGPNRAGPAGIFQPLSDLLKLLQKGLSTSNPRGRFRHNVWFGLQAMALFATVAVLPLGSGNLLVNTDLSALLPFWAALVLSMGVMLLGFSEGGVPGWLGGVRVAAQTLAGAFPALIALLCAAVRSGTFRWSDLVASQGAAPYHWTAFTQPFQFLAFLTFLVSGLVLLGIPPMDGAYQASDLNGGVVSHLGGYRLILFRFGRFYGFFLWAVITSVLFLGGWKLPPGILENLRAAEEFRWIQFLETGIILAKTYLLMFLVIWVARVNPRNRVDQVTDLSWKVLSPAALVALIGCAVWSYFITAGGSR